MAKASKIYTFSESDHVHKIGDQIVPGITTVIKPLTNYGMVPEHIMAAACQFGSNVHKAVELFCYGNLDEENLDPTLALPLQGFKDWLKQERIDPADFIVELPMADANLMFAGIPDLILDGKLIVEIKTRKVNFLTDSLQTAAQQNLWVKNGGTRTKEYSHHVLDLRQDGGFAYTKVNDKQAWPRFRKLLDYYWDTKIIQSWKENK